MPSQRSLKSIFMEAVFVVTLLAVVGHLSVNFWERYFIQNELCQMKTSLHTLKKTIENIGIAYDSLQRDLTGLLIEETQPSKQPSTANDPNSKQKLNNTKYKLDRRRLHDLQLQATIAAQHKPRPPPTPAKTSKAVESVFLKDLVKDFVEAATGPVMNATTITRNPPKSTAVGNDKVPTIHFDHANCKHNKLENTYGCCRDYDCYKYVYKNWKH